MPYQIEKRSTEPLKQALKVFDEGKPARERAWDTCDTDADVETCKAAEEAALTKVREAFFEVTSDRNSRASAMCADLDFMRRIAEMPEI